MIRDALEKYARKIDKGWDGDRSKTVGASEIGLCARRVHWIKKEGRVNADHQEGWGARLRGTMMEEKFWHPALKHRFGKHLLHSGPKQHTFTKGDLSATPDGLLVNLKTDFLRHLGVRDIESDCILVECKSIDPRVNLVEAKKENEYQVQVQLGLIRETTKHKPVYALISYTDASFWNEVAEFPIKFSPEVYAAAKARASKILRAAHGKELQPEGWIAGGKECEYCPYTDACGIIRRSVPENEAAADPQFAAEITDQVRELLGLRMQIAEIEKLERAKQQEIKDRLREKSVRRVPAVVVWSAVKGRQAYDNVAIRNAAEKAGIDVEQFSTVGEPTDRLQVQLQLQAQVVSTTEVESTPAPPAKRKEVK
jgi:hypothetical protein